VHGVAQALVAGRWGGELALELVGDERAGRLGAAGRSGEAVVGVKPPWNQPQLSPAAFSRSPTFLPVIVTASRVEQSS
jgi:hypothetical protein